MYSIMITVVTLDISRIIVKWYDYQYFGKYTKGHTQMAEEECTPLSTNLDPTMYWLDYLALLKYHIYSGNVYHNNTIRKKIRWFKQSVTP